MVNKNTIAQKHSRHRVALGFVRIFLLSFGAFLVACTSDPVRKQQTYSLFTISIEGKGRVSSTSDQNLVLSGTTVTVSALPDSGQVFIGWFGSIASSSNPLSITVSSNTSVSARFAPAPSSELVLIRAGGKQFNMGSTSSLARSEEQPVRRVAFTHDFYIGRFETTQKEYSRITGANPAAMSGPDGVGDSFPVFSVSWYQAVLYCNTRSKAEGYDTIYSYSAVCPQSLQCPYVLENLTIHYERFGYRLPTEAEWEFACNANTVGDYFWGDGTSGESLSGEYAWYAGNSGSHAHPAGQKTPNAYGLYDMSGNVGEWVNDWIAPYTSRDTVNPVGPTGGPIQTYESTFARPVRGGSWRLGSSFLRTATRSGPYSTPAAAMQNDIGFRVVLGAFTVPPPAAIDPLPSDSSGALFTGKISDLITFFGTTRVKLAFVTGGDIKRKLHYIDFSEPGFVTHALPDPDRVFGPAISPDGKSIAYSSNQFGFSGTSHITVRSLADRSIDTARLPTDKAFIPHWWVDPTTGDTCIVYANSASPNNQPAWITERTYRQRMSGHTASGAPIVFPTPGSYHGGISANGRFLGTSFPIARLVDMGISLLDIGDTNIFYFTTPWNGRVDDPQTCNLTMSPSLVDPGDVLLLDFGYTQSSSLLGRAYGFHSVIFKCTMELISDNHVTRWFVVPAGYSEWNDVRYSNHPDFAVAIARPQSDAEPSAIFVINVKDSSYLKIATGTTVASPHIWINPTDLPQTPDQYRMFARYELPIITGGQYRLAEKLRLYWQKRTEAEAVLLGNSPTFYGIDPAYMPRVKSLNLGWPQSQNSTSIIVAMQYILHHSPGLKAMVIELDPGFLNVDGTKRYPQLTGLYDSEGYMLDSKNNFWRSGFPAAIQAKIAAFDSTDWPSVDTKGFIREFERKTGGWGPTLVDYPGYPFDDSVVQSSLSLISQLADSCRTRGIQLLFVEFPESPDYKNTNSIGRFGPTRTQYTQVAQWLRTLETTNANFHFYDANNYGDHDYTDEDAWDCNHLSYIGARKLAGRVDSVLAGYLGR